MRSKQNHTLINENEKMVIIKDYETHIMSLKQQLLRYQENASTQNNETDQKYLEMELRLQDKINLLKDKSVVEMNLKEKIEEKDNEISRNKNEYEKIQSECEYLRSCVLRLEEELNTENENEKEIEKLRNYLKLSENNYKNLLNEKETSISQDKNNLDEYRKECERLEKENFQFSEKIKMMDNHFKQESNQKVSLDEYNRLMKSLENLRTENNEIKE